MLRPGETYRSFMIDRELELPELRMTLTEAHHEPTGAKLVHLRASDPENFFCISFQTAPETSNGVAHILEHLVLCGSEKYPTKDPFFSMSRRSLHTFLNAFTGADFTCYPASSLIEKDFYNLLEVYCDAVYNPLLRKEGFLQEGWRLELENPENLESPLTYRGIVFNEMKGALADPESRLWNRMMEELFPNLTYRFESGGDPSVIPTLSVEELREFHQAHYAPGRSTLFFYGDLPLEKHLDFLDKTLPSKDSAAAPLSPIPSQPRFTTPHLATGTFPSSHHDHALFALGWLTASITDVEDLMALELLLMVLMATDAAPLKRALMDSGLCQDVDVTFMDDYSEAPLILLFRGLSYEHAKAASQSLTTLTLETLKQLAAEGLPHEWLEASLDQLELQKLEIGGGSSPFGLTLFWRAVLQMQHGSTPDSGLVVRTLFETLRKNLKDPQYLSKLILRYLVNNLHRVDLLMLPDAHQASHEAQIEKDQLRDLKNTLSQEDLKALNQQAEQLKQAQLAEKETGSLPGLELSDIPRPVRELKLECHHVGNNRLYTHETFTNGLVYIDVMIPCILPSLEELPIFSFALHCLSEIGSANRSYKETLHRVLAFTGGLGASFEVYPQADNPSLTKPALHFRSQALGRHALPMLELLRDMIAAPNWTEEERLKELLDQEWSHTKSSLSRLSSRLGQGLALATLSEVGTLECYSRGIEYVRWLQQTQASPPSLARLLKERIERSMGAGPIEIVITAEAESLEALEQAGWGGLFEMPLPQSYQESQKFSPMVLPSHVYEVEGRVAFLAEAFSTVPLTHPDSPRLAVASNLIENLVLHSKIREQGGAYGAWASTNRLLGTWQFGTYRDPHIHRSLQVFHESIDWAANGSFSSQSILEAQLSTLQGADAWPAPGSRGIVRWKQDRQGCTTSIRQAWKDGVLNITASDLQKALSSWILPKISYTKPVILGGKEVLLREGFDKAPPLIQVGMEQEEEPSDLEEFEVSKSP